MADGEQECFLSEFYNESDIEEKDSFTEENQSLENIIASFQARAILKKLRREKEMGMEKSLSADSAFCDLKIIYHGSEIELESKDGTNYLSESVLIGKSDYEFLCALKSKTSAEKFKVWLEFSYKGYEHGNFCSRLKSAKTNL